MFSIDERIVSTSFILGDWPLSTVLLKNEINYPWFILVPRKENVQEIYQLNTRERQMLMEEINQLSLLVSDQYKSIKLNIGALGNIVSQLHVHVVARNSADNLWPQGIWQASFVTSAYQQDYLEGILPKLNALVSEYGQNLCPAANASIEYFFLQSRGAEEPRD